MKRLLLVRLVLACSALPMDSAVAQLSPACWSAPRMVHSGPASAEFANRIRLLTTASPLPDAVASPRNSYRFASRQPDTTRPGPWHGAVQISGGDIHWLLAFEGIAQPLEPRWLTDNLLFLRVAWGRIQFSDLVFDAARGELVFHQQLRDGTIEFEQYRQSCTDPQLADSPQCQCPADWAEDSSLPPSQPALDELIGLLEMPGLFGPGESGGPQAARPIVPLLLYPSPAIGTEGVISIDDPWALQTREYGYEAPAAIVLEEGLEEGLEKVLGKELKKEPQREPEFYRIALKNGASGWVSSQDAGRFMGLADLLPGRLAYLTPAWDGRLWTLQQLAGEGRWQRLRIVDDPVAETAIVVDEVRITATGPWLKIGIYDGEVCAGPEPPIRWRGWVPAYSAAGRLTAWFHSRGC